MLLGGETVFFQTSKKRLLDWTSTFLLISAQMTQAKLLCLLIILICLLQTA